MTFSRRLPIRTEDMQMVFRAVGIPALHQVSSRFSAELRRARRYERPLSVLVVSSEAADLPQDGADIRSALPFTRAIPPSLVAFLFLGCFLRKALREDDVLASAADGLRYVVVLPEADEPDAKGAIRRLSHDFAAFASLRLCAGLAVFPRDGLVGEVLLDHAHRTWQTRIVETSVPMNGNGAAGARGASNA